MVCVFNLAFTQGPRGLSCQRCDELEEEIGNKLKARSPIIGLKKLENLCPELTHENSTLYCEYLVSSWKKNILIKKKDLKHKSVIAQLFTMIVEWLLKSLSLTNYKDLCEIVHICQSA